MDEIDPRKPAASASVMADAGGPPPWAEREDARSRREVVAESRQGWTFVLQLVIPVLLVVLAALGSRFIP